MTEQARYQVSFDWGADGLAAIGTEADVVAWVDALPSDDRSLPRFPSHAGVIRVDLRTAAACAAWIVEAQTGIGRRLRVCVIAAGERRADGTPRFAVEDLLAAGALIGRLSRLGIDATSPEAAAAEASFAGLERAVGHLFTACVTAGERPAAGGQRVDESLGAADVVVVQQPGA